MVTSGQQYHVGEKPSVHIHNRHAGTPNKTKTKDTRSLDTSQFVTLGLGSRIGVDEGNLQFNSHEYGTELLVVVVVVVFTLKTVLISIQYPSLSYSSRQRNEFPWSHANPK